MMVSTVTVKVLTISFTFHNKGTRLDDLIDQCVSHTHTHQQSAFGNHITEFNADDLLENDQTYLFVAYKLLPLFLLQPM